MKNTRKIAKKMQSQQLENLRIEIEKNLSKVVGIGCKEFDLQLIKISNPDNHTEDFFQFTISTNDDALKTKFNKLLDSQSHIVSFESIQNKLIFLVNMDQFPAFYESLRKTPKVNRTVKV